MPNIYNEIPDKTRDLVVTMYQNGERVSDIAAETGVTRPTIYWILRTRGVRPQRNTREDQLSAAELAEMLREAEREIGRLQERLERREAD
jgi:transposase